MLGLSGCLLRDESSGEDGGVSLSDQNEPLRNENDADRAPGGADLLGLSGCVLREESSGEEGGLSLSDRDEPPRNENDANRPPGGADLLGLSGCVLRKLDSGEVGGLSLSARNEPPLNDEAGDRTLAQALGIAHLQKGEAGPCSFDLKGSSPVGTGPGLVHSGSVTTMPHRLRV